VSHCGTCRRWKRRHVFRELQ